MYSINICIYYYVGLKFCVYIFLQLQEEKTRATHEKLELCEQKLAQFATLPEIEQELKQRMEALTQVRAQVRDSFNRSNFFSILFFSFFPQPVVELVLFISLDLSYRIVILILHFS